MAANETDQPEATIILEVFRYRPEQDDEPTFQRYDVPYREDWVVLDALNHVKDQIDGTLSYRWSCRMGVCGSCGMMVNGEPKLTCAAFLRDYYPEVIRIEPLNYFPVIRDLVINMDDFLHKLTEVKAWLVPKEDKPVSEGEFCKRRPSWRTTNSSACVSIACSVMRRAPCTPWIRSSSARRPSHSPSATTSTHATGLRTNGRT